MVRQTVEELGRLDVLVNNAAEQHPCERLEDLPAEQLERTFRTNIFAYFYLTKAALPHLTKGSAIINTTSVTAYRGSEHLLDYAATKGAIVGFTRSLAKNLAPTRHPRQRASPPGRSGRRSSPPASTTEKVATFGGNVPMGRPGEPEEIAPSFVFLASDDASYMTGQVLHPNGGEIVNG